jgi:hypothetical protein
VLHAHVGEFSRVGPGAHVAPDSSRSWRWRVSAAVSSEHVDVWPFGASRCLPHLDVRVVETSDVLVIWVQGRLRMLAGRQIVRQHALLLQASDVEGLPGPPLLLQHGSRGVVGVQASRQHVVAELRKLWPWRIRARHVRLHG